MFHTDKYLQVLLAMAACLDRGMTPGSLILMPTEKIDFLVVLISGKQNPIITKLKEYGISTVSEIVKSTASNYLSSRMLYQDVT